ncbi:MAG: dTDP-4-dehydrorhamnose reductase [Flaviaesturariibacter sp.]|nr:dTDP-4-dehydrorhamnose reductase [Flaviaesturariibacter sp.]
MRTSNLEIWGGLECTINRVGDQFIDQLEWGNVYENPRVDEIAALGIRKLRFPILWERHQPSPGGPINWDWTQAQVAGFADKGIEIIAGLVHHGSGPAYTNLLDPDFPKLLAAYARQVAEKFPSINYYTPVNEPLTTARFSGLYGLWYPHARNDRSFLEALLNQLEGVVLSMSAICEVNPAAKLVQTEDLGKTYSTPGLAYQATFENERRWLTFDILCGRLTPKHKLWKYFIRKGISAERLQFFIDHPCVPDLFGFNHYVTSERFLDQDYRAYPRHLWGGNRKHRYVDTEAARSDVREPHGISVLLQEAWQRYQQPIAITEVHLHCHREEQIRWFKYVYDAACASADNGVGITAVTAWALLGSTGWNNLLTKPGGVYEPGVFDLRGGRLRPTALTSYIKSMTTSEPFRLSHMTDHQGWWKRPVRFVHKPAPDLQPVASASPERLLLIIGRNGTLGRAFARVCAHRAIPYRLLGRQDCDIADIASVEAAIDQFRPWAIINAAGYVRVDDAEQDAERCFRENTTGPANLGIACQRKGVQLVSFSSDLVFDGVKGTPYVESDTVNPLNIYGRSKANSEAELARVNPAALVIRTSAFFGPWDDYNFLHWVDQNLRLGVPSPAASDLIVSPTYVPDLVHATLDLLIDEERGIWHLANEGAISWADLAKLAARKRKAPRSLVQQLPASAFNYPAMRPRYSVLGSERATLLPSLDNAIERYFAEKQQVAVLQD